MATAAQIAAAHRPSAKSTTTINDLNLTSRGWRVASPRGRIRGQLKASSNQTTVSTASSPANPPISKVMFDGRHCICLRQKVSTGQLKGTAPLVGSVFDTAPPLGLD